LDDQRFDALAKRVGTSRRSLLKKMVGLGGAATVARLGAGEAEAARRGYGGPSNPSDSRVGTLSITWEYAVGQACYARATLTGWDPNTTYTVEYAYNTSPTRRVSGSQQLTTDANGAASARMGLFGRNYLVFFSVNGVIVSGRPEC
jgi:hypothetical protein